MSKLLQDFHDHLAGITKEERLKALHIALRNIPREYVKEYLECDEGLLDKMINPEGVA